MVILNCIIYLFSTVNKDSQYDIRVKYIEKQSSFILTFKFAIIITSIYIILTILLATTLTINKKWRKLRDENNTVKAFVVILPK